MSKKQQDYVVIPLHVEYDLRAILGERSAQGLPEGMLVKYWIELCKRLVANLEKSIDANMETDKSHSEQIQFAIKDMKEALKTSVGRAREPRLVLALVRTCLLFLGDQPNHWHKRVVNRPKHYLLHGVRTVHYTQSRRQMVNLILRTYANDSKAELREELMARTRKMKPQEFLDWFRKTHHDDYFKLF